MVVFSPEEVRAATLAYFEGDAIAADVWIEKYALKNSQGELLEKTPDDMHKRLAREFARVESKYPNSMSESDIYDLLKNFNFVVPQGSPMSAIGNPYKVQSLSNCFVVAAPKDSYGGILHTDQEIVQIMKRRGGVGFDISNIRPQGLPTANAAGTTDGIAVFMERFSNTCREVAQGGRRGAEMQTISCNHPQIETFIDIKRDLKKVTGANISVRLSDEFMEAVESDSEFTLRWPVDASVEDAKVTKVVRARHVWDKIIDAAWASAEPGIFFWDTVIRETPADIYGFHTVSSNPCAELVLSEYDSCRLLLINLYSYVDKKFTTNATFNIRLFAEHVKKSQRLMDDLVDLEIEKIDKIIAKIELDPESNDTKIVEKNLWEKIKKACVDGRRTGLGITGLGDALAAIGIKYGSKASIEMTEVIYKCLAVNAHEASVEMAEERGAFAAWKPNVHKGHPFMERLREFSKPEINEKFDRIGRRNIALTTTAPAGSVSTLTRTTSGIEPAYLLSYKRRRKLMSSEIEMGETVDFKDALGDQWKEYEIYHHGFFEWMNTTGLKDVSLSPYFKATSQEIDWESSVDLQAAAQKFVEHSISKTCNLPENVSRDIVAAVYMRAWKAGCKGFTVYREGSRSGVLVSNDDNPKDEKKTDGSQPSAIIESHAPKRPKELACEIHRAKVTGEDWTILVGLFENRPYEVFGGLSKYIEIPKKRKHGKLIKNGRVGGISTYNVSIPIGDDDEILIKDVVSTFDNPLFGSFTRMISLALRHGIPVSYVVEQLQKQENETMQSLSKVIARVLKNYIVDGTKSTAKACPQCSNTSMSYQEGCILCTSCGWSKCG